MTTRFYILIVVVPLSVMILVLSAHAEDPNIHKSPTCTEPKLRESLLNQPDFKADLAYYGDALSGVDSHVERVLKKGKMFRFEVVNTYKDEPSKMTILGYPGKKIIILFPQERSFTYKDEDWLSRAAFTTLAGVDLYYETRALMNKTTHLECVSEEVYLGHKCLKVQASNDKLLAPEVDLEALWFANGPLYFHIATDLNNLVIDVTSSSEGTDEEGFRYENISLKADDLHDILFQIPDGFTERHE